MKRLPPLLLIVIGTIVAAIGAGPAFGYAKTCSENAFFCTEAANSIGAGGEYTTGTLAGGCIWQEGGASIPGTTNTFGGNSSAEFGPLLQLFYPAPGGVVRRFNDFRNVLSSNPCPA